MSYTSVEKLTLKWLKKPNYSKKHIYIQACSWPKFNDQWPWLQNEHFTWNSYQVSWALSDQKHQWPGTFSYKKQTIWTKHLLNFKCDQKHQWPGTCSYLKKNQFEQNICSTSSVTKNTNDLVKGVAKKPSFLKNLLL